MAFTRKTWLWIIVGVVGFGVVGIIAIAGFGMYFVSTHVHQGKTTSAEAFRTFDDIRARFKTDKPMFEVDNHERPRQVRKFSDIPTSTSRAETAWILAWDPDSEKLVKVSMPFWLLRLGRQKIDVSSGGFDFQRLQIDVNELHRVGPVLLFDFRSTGGERVLIWTQ